MSEKHQGVRDYRVALETIAQHDWQQIGAKGNRYTLEALAELIDTAKRALSEGADVNEETNSDWTVYIVMNGGEINSVWDSSGAAHARAASLNGHRTGLFWVVIEKAVESSG